MSEINDARIYCISESCEDLGIELTEDQMKRIAEDLAFHIEMEYEVESYRHVKGKADGPKYVPADNVQLYTQATHAVGTAHYSYHEAEAGILGRGLYSKETLYIKKS